MVGVPDDDDGGLSAGGVAGVVVAVVVAVLLSTVVYIGVMTHWKVCRRGAGGDASMQQVMTAEQVEQGTAAMAGAGKGGEKEVLGTQTAPRSSEDGGQVGVEEEQVEVERTRGETADDGEGLAFRVHL